MYEQNTRRIVFIIIASIHSNPKTGVCESRDHNRYNIHSTRVCLCELRRMQWVSSGHEKTSGSRKKKDKKIK